MSTKSKAGESPATHRFILPIQSTGRVGKSTVIEALFSWADFAGITVGALDADEEHHSLSDAFPERAILMPGVTTDPDAFKKVIQLATRKISPLFLADFPAQATRFLLEQFEKFSALDALESAGVRTTILLFPADDKTAQVSLANVVNAFGDKADYILVSNLARFTQTQFDASLARDSMTALGAKELHIPTITKSTLEEVSKASRKAGRVLPLAEASELLDDTLSKIELSGWVQKMRLQFQELAPLLVDPALIKNRVKDVTQGAGKTSQVDPFNPLDF